MDILYTVEEKYLSAVEELNWGELPKALHLLNELITSNPEYGRAHYQLGCIYHESFKDYQTAGYHYKACIKLEPTFPDVYARYLDLAITLNLHKLVAQVAHTALAIPGVCKATIYESLGQHAEMLQDYTTAALHYKQALNFASSQNDHVSLLENVRRINDKHQSKQQMVYAYQG